MRPFLSLVLISALLGAPALAAEKAAPKKKEPAAKSETAIPEDDFGLGPLFRATPEGVRARLGDPDVSRAEGKGAFWTYRLPHCALFLFFHEGPKGLRVSGASTGARKRGEPPLGVEACLASAVQLPVDPA
jgi:hypothetical protein